MGECGSGNNFKAKEARRQRKFDESHKGRGRKRKKEEEEGKERSNKNSVCSRSLHTEDKEGVTQGIRDAGEKNRGAMVYLSIVYRCIFSCSSWHWQHAVADSKKNDGIMLDRRQTTFQMTLLRCTYFDWNFFAFLVPEILKDGRSSDFSIWTTINAIPYIFYCPLEGTTISQASCRKRTKNLTNCRNIDDDEPQIQRRDFYRFWLFSQSFFLYFLFCARIGPP